jgi:alkanesulfonate monooxygenase SsuD/methylene tetrahydromethanopterin reductase-like flavin-dependent oxidoreductase (luciferase family)
MRRGIVLAGFTALPAADFVAAAREAERRGYHTAWLGEVAGYDALVMSAVIVSHTERLRVATGVLPVQTRTPIVLGMASASLNHLAPGRFALGLGLSSRSRPRSPRSARPSRWSARCAGATASITRARSSG